MTVGDWYIPPDPMRWKITSVTGPTREEIALEVLVALLKTREGWPLELLTQTAVGVADLLLSELSKEPSK